jgi:endonuclease/exonuclease/phosphatase family metal-dependent hydrolase
MCKTSDLRIMSINIRCDNDGDKTNDNGWDKRKLFLAKIIQFHDPDLIGFQEVLSNQLDFLKMNLVDYDFVGVGREDGINSGEYEAVFYKKIRFQVLESNHFWLSENTDKPQLGWDAACTRICTWAKFYDQKAVKEVAIFNTHFDHVGKQAVIKSAALLLDKIDIISGNIPTIITGDFNSGENSSVYEILTGKSLEYSHCNNQSLIDSKYISQLPHIGPDFTYHDFKANQYLQKYESNLSWEGKPIGSPEAPSSSEAITIDYIFIKNGLEVMKHCTSCDNQNGKYPSDHFQVIADMCYTD